MLTVMLIDGDQMVPRGARHLCPRGSLSPRVLGLVAYDGVIHPPGSHVAADDLNPDSDSREAPKKRRPGASMRGRPSPNGKKPPGEAEEPEMERG